MDTQYNIQMTWNLIILLTSVIPISVIFLKKGQWTAISSGSLDIMCSKKPWDQQNLALKIKGVMGKLGLRQISIHELYNLNTNIRNNPNNNSGLSKFFLAFTPSIVVSFLHSKCWLCVSPSGNLSWRTSAFKRLFSLKFLFRVWAFF